jgi:hypothetical protein
MGGRSWLRAGAAVSLFMALCQAVISISPAAAAYFGAPPGLLHDRLKLFVIGEGAALIPVVFGLYALSGAGSFPRLPLLRPVLVVAGTLYSLRGLFILLTVFEVLGILKAPILIQGVMSHLVFLAAGIAYTVGTVLAWKAMASRGAERAVLAGRALDADRSARAGEGQEGKNFVS